MANRIRFLLIIVFGIIVLVSFLTSNDKYPNPTEAFYVNDFAGVLMEGTKSSILREGERLYYVSEDEVDGGSQVVFATFSVENLDDIANYDKTDIYRQWEIGYKDMGVLVLLFFEESTEELLETQIEVGYRMEQYLTPGELGAMVDSSIGNEEFNWLLDIAVMNLEYRILEEIYIDAYDYESFGYDMDVFYEYLLDYTSDETISITPMNVFMYLLSPFNSSGTILSTLLPYGLLFLFGVGFVANKGAGGSSGGMGIFRRRR